MSHRLFSLRMLGHNHLPWMDLIIKLFPRGLTWSLTLFPGQTRSSTYFPWPDSVIDCLPWTDLVINSFPWRDLVIVFLGVTRSSAVFRRLRGSLTASHLIINCFSCSDLPWAEEISLISIISFFPWTGLVIDLFPLGCLRHRLVFPGMTRTSTLFPVLSRSSTVFPGLTLSSTAFPGLVDYSSPSCL